MLNFVAIDVETAAASWDTICALSLVRVRDGAVVDQFYTLVNPECDFSPMNTRIHGITTEKVADAPTLPTVYGSIIDFIGSDILVSHNIPFDANSLFRGFTKYGLPIPTIRTLCTLACSRVFTPDLPNLKLTTLCKHYGIAIDHHHNAADDALACAELMIAIAKQLEANDLEDISKLLHVFFGYMDKDHVISPSSDISLTRGGRAGNPYTLLDDIKQAVPNIANEISMSHLKGGTRIAFKCADNLLFYYNVSAYPFIRIIDIADGRLISDFASQYKDGNWKLPIDGAFLYDKFLAIISDLCRSKYEQNGAFSFGCCNDFIRCSDELKCLKADNPDYRGCLYRKNLEAGRVFFGVNKNI